MEEQRNIPRARDALANGRGGEAAVEGKHNSFRPAFLQVNSSPAGRPVESRSRLSDLVSACVVAAVLKVGLEVLLP